MLRSQLVRAVLQTVLLSAIASVVSHHLFSSAYQNVSRHQLWKNFTDAIDLMEDNAKGAAVAGMNETIVAHNQTADSATSALNETKVFNFTSADFGLDNTTFYKETLPLELFFLTILCPIYFCWHLWLERGFPARPRPVFFTPHEKDGEDSVQEEEVIQRWIAQGKIRRASLSWWNTFVKWIVNLIVAPLWMDGIKYTLEQCYHLRLPKKPTWHSLKWNLLDIFVLKVLGSFFGIRPLSTLAGFVIAPAHQRMVFEAGVRLAWKSFCAAFLQIVLPWFADTEIAAMMVGNMTEGARKEMSKQRPATLPDEL